MQVARVWTPPSGPLGRLSSASAERARRSRALTPYDTQNLAALGVAEAPNILQTLRNAGTGVAVIAELKRRSPSRGAIAPELDAEAQIRAYAAGGAAAYSVLTETSEFGGTLDDLTTAAALGLGPCIRKDFITDTIQLVEARAAGASAALLIARALTGEQLHALVFAARVIGIEPLVEVRSADELADAIAAGALMIGVNNRNLETLEIDASVSAELLPQIPITHIAIYESGVVDRDDVARAAAYGADAVLVGSSISGAADPQQAVAALTGVPRIPRRS